MSPAQTCSSETLLTLLRAGDVQVLGPLLECLGDKLQAEARRRCRSEEEAEDAVQDAALSALRYGPGFRGDGQVDRWLLTLVASACGRMRRGLKRDAERHDSDLELASLEDSPELLAARAQLAQTLAQAVGVLSPKDQAILLLAEGQGWTSPEIAAHLGMTPGAVRSRLSRSRRALRAELAELGLTSLGEQLPSR